MDTPAVGRAAWWWLVLLVLAVLVSGVLVTVVDLPSPRGLLLRSEPIAGPAGPVVFVLLYAACTLAPLPRNVLSTAAGAIFGFGWGLLLAYLGSLLGAAAAFWLVRRLGREAVRRLGGPRAVALRATLARQGFLTVLGARLAPVVPFTAVNYAAGLTDISGRAYWLGTAIGIVPGTAGYVAVGAYAAAPGSWPVEVAVGSLVLLGVAAVVARRRRSRDVGAADASAEAGDLGGVSPYPCRWEQTWTRHPKPPRNGSSARART